MHFLLLSTLLIGSVTAQTQNFEFLVPPSASSTDSTPITFTENSVSNISWVTNISNYTIDFLQFGPDSSTPTLSKTLIMTNFVGPPRENLPPQTISFPWDIPFLQLTNLSTSTFMLNMTINEPASAISFSSSGNGTTKSFNITAPPSDSFPSTSLEGPASTSSTGQISVNTAAVNGSSSSKSSGARGKVVGVGLVLPIVLALGFCG